MIEIVVAIITGCLSLLGVVISNLAYAKKSENNMRVAQAVTNEKIEELTREVREHNNFARRVPTLEREVIDIKNHIERLEGFHMGRSDK